MAERPKLKFFDIVSKQQFETDQYEVVEKEIGSGKIVKIAYATSPYTGKRVAKLLGSAKKAQGA